MAPSAGAPPLQEPFATVLALYDEGRYLDALEAGRPAGPFEAWPAPGPLVLAGRLVHRLGAPRRSTLLFLRAYRACRGHPDAQYYYVGHLLERRGAFAAWQERRRLGLPEGADATALGDYHGQCALLLAALRDFDAAEEHLARGWEAAPGRRYWHVERVAVHHFEDRHLDAARAAEEGLAADDRYAPTVLAAAQSYVLLERPGEALAVLRRGGGAGQSADVADFTAHLLLKLGRLDEAEEAIARWEALTPLREKGESARVAVARSGIALRRRDLRAALAQLVQVPHPFHQGIAANLRERLADAAAPPPRRVELAVPYVQQQQRTCSPATLTAVSRFWDRPAEHLAVAEEICYDGTPAHSERRWADEHGWLTREFRVDWASATALLDRGVPFTLTLRGVVEGHLLAVIGYDEATRVLLTRDPSTPETGEINGAGLLDEGAANGPRGMAMVPRERAALLEGLALPDAAVYDLSHALDLALEAHDRDRAVALRARLAAVAPAHPLTLSARRAIACYDANPHEDLAAIDALLARDPADQSLQYARLQGLRQVAGRAERLAFLEDVARRPHADPVLQVEYAGELSADERALPRAEWILGRAMRRRPDDARAIYLLSSLRWQAGDLAGGADTCHVAACLDDHRDASARSYFTACRWLGKTEAGLAFLRRRLERLGGRSGEPAVTLFGALESLDRTPEAFAVLDEGVRRRPDDGELRLFAAERCARYGRSAEAAAHRVAAAGRVRPARWLAESARAARLGGDRRAALERWREVLATQPLDLEAHGAVAQILSEMGAPRDAAEHLRRQCAAFPHHAGLHRLLYQWTENEPSAAREPILRALVAIDPADGWAQRELALNLLGQGRAAEALAQARSALEIDSADAAGHTVLGHILLTQGSAADAEASFRRAVDRFAGAVHAVYGLLDACGDAAARRVEVLAYVEARVLEQPVSGDGLLAYRQAARGVLTPDELLASLRRLHAARPDLWQAWSALVQHLAEMGTTDEALALARAATARFPMVVAPWRDLAAVHHARLEVEERIAVLERCRDVDPEAPEPVLDLAEAYAQAGRVADAERLLEAAIRRLPLAARLRGALAGLVHSRGEVARATDILREALRVDPAYEWAWQQLAEWSAAAGGATGALDLARAFAESRAGESQPWARLAELQLSAGRLEAALDSAEHALKANPRDATAHDLRAAALARLRRYREAEEACRPAVFGDDVPVLLRGRAAWVDAMRGDLTAAIDRMRAALATHPDYRWGWYRLLEWCADRGQLGHAVEAAERLAWLDAGAVEPLGWLGDLRLRLDHTRLAKAAFRRAMQLRPDYLFAGFSYFRLLCRDRELDDARRTLQILRPHARAGRILAAGAALAAAAGDRAAALLAVRDLCARADAEAEDLDAAADAVAAAGWSAPLERALREATDAPAWHTAVPRTWARVRTARGRSTAFHVPRLARLGPPGRDAVCAILDALGDAAKGPDGRNAAVELRTDWDLFWIRRVCRDWRGSDDRYWGKVGYVLVCRGKARAVIRWMRDWRGRRGVESWMLQNLAVALLAARRDRQAREVLRHIGREMAPAVDVNPAPMLWAAVSACLDGDLALAERLLYETPEDKLQPGSRTFRRYAVAVLEALRAPPGPQALTPERRAALDGAAAVNRPGTAEDRLERLATYRVARHARARLRALRAWVRLRRPGVTAAGLLGALLVIRLVTLMLG